MDTATTSIVIPQELFAPAESSSFSGAYALPVLAAGPDLYDFVEPLSWRVDIVNTGGAMLVTGTVEGTGRTACARCLEPFDVSVIGDIEGYFLLHEGDCPEDDMEEDEFAVLGPDKVIDLAPLIAAAVLVDLPLVPLCSDDCKGLCPDCGTNLNTGTCACSEKRSLEDCVFEQAVNPFSVLQGLDLESGDGKADEIEEK